MTCIKIFSVRIGKNHVSISKEEYNRLVYNDFDDILI